jgi:LysM domain
MTPRFVLAAAVAVATLAAPRAARAQIPEVQPDGTLSEPAAPAPAPSQAPPPVVVTPEGQPVQPGQPAQPGQLPQEGQPAGGAGGGYYHVDENGLGEEETDTITPGAVPPTHVVRSGDTLWDLCWSYFNNPWEWPRVWSYNPEITNPHWIYPGDQVRLRSRTEERPAPRAEPQPRAQKPPRAAPTGYFDLRQLAFLASEDLALAIAIDGSPEEKIMLVAGDEVYLTYPEGRPPRVGQRFAVYLERERVHHPKSGDEVGAFVRIVGEVEVISAAAGKRARGVILDSVDAIERGMGVGPVRRQFRNIEPVAAVVELEGVIVAEIKSEELIGTHQVVIIDRGERDQVKVGNRMHVIRRGDAYETVMGPYTNIGKNDARYPARSIGEILVVQTGEQSSIAIVARSEKELGVGDRVLMNRSRGRSRSR